jgi:hypothetical protein
MFRIHHVQPYVILQNLRHQSVHSAADRRQQHQNVGALISRRRRLRRFFILTIVNMSLALDCVNVLVSLRQTVTIIAMARDSRH